MSSSNSSSSSNNKNKNKNKPAKVVADEAQQSSSRTVLISNVLGSTAAGIIGRICTHPLDTAKARLQAVYSSSATAPPVAGTPLVSSSSSAPTTPFRGNNPYRGPFDALLQTARTEGIAGLYRGFGAVLVGGTPGTVVYLCAYDLAKQHFSDLWRATTPNTTARGDTEESFLVHFAAGMTAETIACVVYVPVDVVKERMQVQRRIATEQGVSNHHQSTYYRNSYDALQKIVRTEGVAGIYRGYAATLASFGPFSALYFVFYERFKLWARQQQQQQLVASRVDTTADNLPFQSVLLCSASAGALASWITSPLDMAKLRLQVSRGQQAAAVAAAATATESGIPTTTVAFRGVADCLQQAYLSGGIPALFRGAGARVLHFTPATTITMTSYETCRIWIARTLSMADDQ